MKYKSKVDWWYFVFVLLFSYCTFHVAYNFSTAQDTREHTLLVLLFLLCEFIFLLPNLFFTFYILEADTIYVRSGYFYCKDIAYEDIVKIRDTKAIFAACGLAMERIEITYKYKDSIDTVLISPKEKEKVKLELKKKVKKQNAKDLSSFIKTESDSNDQPLNGIIH